MVFLADLIGNSAALLHIRGGAVIHGNGLALLLRDLTALLLHHGVTLPAVNSLLLSPLLCSTNPLASGVAHRLGHSVADRLGHGATAGLVFSTTGGGRVLGGVALLGHRVLAHLLVGGRAFRSLEGPTFS